MADRLKKKPATRRDAVDAARLKLQGDPSHINPREDRLLRETMPEAHGRVVTRGLLAEAGRRGDDRVTLLTAGEAALLKARGGAGTVNPASGLLEFYGDSPGTSGGGGGEGGDNGVGGPGNGSAGTGPGQGEAGSMGVGGNTSFSDNYGYGWGAESQIGGVGLGGSTSFTDNYNVGWNEPESQIGFAAQQPDWNEYNFVNYAPKDTWQRMAQEWWDPSLPQPGRLQAPNRHGPGVMGTMLSQLAGNPFSAAMSIGAAMGRASSPATQAASAAEMSERGSVNSGGNQGSHSVLDMDAKLAALGGALPAGTASGAQTADLVGGNTPGLTTAPGYTVNAAGQVVPTSEARTMTGLPTPIENLLSDYIWRGRQGGGFGW